MIHHTEVSIDLRKYASLVLLLGALYAGVQWGCLTDINKVTPLKEVVEASQDATVSISNTIKLWQAELTMWVAIWYFGLDCNKCKLKVKCETRVL